MQSSSWKKHSGLLLTTVPDMLSFVQACCVLDKQIASLPCMCPPYLNVHLLSRLYTIDPLSRVSTVSQGCNSVGSMLVQHTLKPGLQFC